MAEALTGFAVLLLLVLLRMPIAFAMGLTGVVGFSIMLNWPAAMAMVANVTYSTGLAYTLSVAPLFILMGNFVTKAGLSEELYTASYAFLGHRRGGLAMATIVACGGFGAICGSSLATAATMAKVAMPPMRKFGYADSLAAGSIAAGGTLGILIPPSMPDDITGMAETFKENPMIVMIIILAIYLVLGCVLESMSMILLTIPVFHPLVVHLGFDMIWFGIVVVVVTEISLITPPIGLNVLVLRGVLTDVPTSTIFKGIFPFWVADIIRMIILVAVPSLTMFLPRILF